MSNKNGRLRSDVGQMPEKFICFFKGKPLNELARAVVYARISNSTILRLHGLYYLRGPYHIEIEAHGDAILRERFLDDINKPDLVAKLPSGGYVIVNKITDFFYCNTLSGRRHCLPYH